MSKMSILVGLGSSGLSEATLKVGLQIAAKAQCRMTALHILEEYDQTEEAPCLELHKTSVPFAEVQKQKAEELRNKYSEIFKEFEQVECNLEIDQGKPLDLLCEYARHHDILIVGSGSENHNISVSHNGNFLKLVTQQCATPLLIVKNGETDWQESIHVISDVHFNPIFLRNSLCLAKLLGLKSEIYYMLEHDLERTLDEVRSHLGHTLTETKDVSIKMLPLCSTDSSADSKERSKLHEQLNLEELKQRNKLIIIPTMVRHYDRATISGESTSLLLEALKPNQLLLWPEEYESDVPTGNIEIHLQSR